MKKWKTLSILFLGALATMIMVGCSCSTKKVNPTKIDVNVAEQILFVGNSANISYSITPSNSSNVNVSVSVNKPDVLTLNATSFNAAQGDLTVTANSIYEEGVVVTFSIVGTNLKASTVVKVLPDPIKLNTVTNVEFSNTDKKIRFKSVGNTNSYVVNIDGAEFNVTDPSTSSAEHYVDFQIFNDQVPLDLNAKHIVKVKAVGDGVRFADGDYSNEYKFIKYAPVTGIVASNGVVSWDTHQLAKYYSVQVNGVPEEILLSTNSYQIKSNEAKDYDIQVSAVSTTLQDEEGYYLFASDYTESYKVTKLSTPTLTLNNNKIVDGKVVNSVITFPVISGATAYNVKVTPALGEQNEFQVTTNEIEIDDRFLPDTSYTVSVNAVGNETTTIIGEESSIVVKKLGVTDNFQILNNELIFNGIALASSYEVVFVKGDEVKTINTTQTTVNLAENLNASGTYSISVRAIGLTTDDVNIANGVAVNTLKTITKLANVNITGVNNSGMVSWDAVSGTTNYAVYLDNNYTSDSNTNSYTFSSSSLSAGSHNVKVVAVGDGITTISSGLNNAVKYDFKKLDVVTSFSVLNDLFKFTGVTGALNYSVKLNSGEYKLIGNNPDGEQSFALLDVIDGTNEVYVISVGDDVKNISSNSAKFSVERLSAPTNLRTLNGVLTWDLGSGVKYKVYVGDDQEGVETEGNTFNNFSKVGEEQVVKVKAIPTNGNYISSAFATKTIIKLNAVNDETIKVNSISGNNELSNYKLVWESVVGATAYNITIYAEQSLDEQFYYNNITETSFVLPEEFDAGKYFVSISAMGDSSTEGVGYITSEASLFNFRKLAQPTNVKVVNGKLVWSVPETDSPRGYLIGITYNDNESFVEVGPEIGYELSTEDYELEDITIRVKSLGDEISLVTGKFSDIATINRVSEVKNLKIENGVITWDIHENPAATYLVYYTSTPEDESSYQLANATISKGTKVTCEISNLQENVEYSIKVVAVVNGMLNSNESSILKVTKLPTVTNFKISKGVFSWNAVANATKYKIDDGAGTIKESSSTTLNFSEFNKTISGDYVFNIYAVGSANESLQGYINSNKAVNSLTVTILAPATSASVQNNHLIIVNDNIKKPIKYRIEFQNSNVSEGEVVIIETDELDIDLNLIDLSEGAGLYNIYIYSVGNDEQLISSTTALIITAEKIDETTLGLAVVDGEISWNADINKKFDVYVNDELKVADVVGNTVKIDNLEKGVNYTINIVAKENGKINSAISADLIVQKLPDVTGFKIRQSLNNSNTGASGYWFAWDSFGGEYDSNSNDYSFEVVAVTPLEPFNGETENGLTTSISLNYGPEVYGQYSFNIKANGTAYNTVRGYLNGDMLSNPLQVTILKALEFVSYDRLTNTLTFTNENTNASGIQIAYQKNDENAEFLYNTKISGNATSFVLDYPESLLPGEYFVYFNALGDDNNNILMSSKIVKYQISLLSAPSNLRMENGYLNWTHEGGEGIYYQIYIDGVLLTYNQEVPGTEPETTSTVVVNKFASPSEAKVVNDLILDNSTHKIVVKTIKEGSVDSKASEEFTVKKLNSVADAKFQNSKLYWSSIPNATGYVIGCSNSDMATLFGELYNAELNGILVNGKDAGLSGYTLPLTMPAGSYGFYVVPVGNTVDSSEIGYLTGTAGNIAGVNVISNVTNIRMESGIIVWDSVLSAVSYKVELFKGETVSGTSESFIVYTNKASLESSNYASGFYMVRIWAQGDGETSLNCSTNDIAEIKVYKAPVPTDYKVRNGFISWTVSLKDPYILALNGGTDYNEETGGALLLAAKGDPNAEMDKVNNMQHFRNLEVTINGKVYKNQTIYSVELDLKNSILIYTYDFNFTNIQNPYSVAIRFIGSTSTPTEPEPEPEPKPEPEPTPEPEIKTALLAEDGNKDEGVDEGVDDGTGVQVEYYNIASGNYSQTITGYKLAKPQTPVSAVGTMVQNDSLYFSKVYVEGFEVNYLITASNKGDSTERINFEVNETNKSKYEASVSDSIGGSSVSVYKVPVADLGIVTGQIYELRVRALGTPDSDLTEGNIYLTSGFDHMAEVEMLSEPTIYVKEGILTFSNIQTSISQELKIWSTSIGQIYNKDLADADNGKYAESIIINPNAVSENPFISISDDGLYKYSLIDNPLLPAGSYYVTCKAIGDGVSKISSKESNVDTLGRATLTVYKLDNLTGLQLSGGMFKWDALKYNKNDVIFDVKSYYLTILQRDTVTQEVNEFKVVVKADEVLSSDKVACYYDLPSIDYPATRNGNILEYAVKVSAGGSFDTELDNEYGSKFVVSGNSSTSNYYKRLMPPQDVKMVNGVLTWLQVDGASKYEVYLLDQELNSYGIITDGNYRQLTFNGDMFASNAVINLRIRAIPGSLTQEYLNGEFSVEILAKKLEKPNLRVVDGIIKWNNTDLNYAIATGTSVKITKLENKDDPTGTVIFESDFVDIKDIMNTDAGYDLTGLDSEIGAGYYKIEVTYVGSNGYVTLPTEDNDGGDGGDGGEGGEQGGEDVTPTADDGTEEPEPEPENPTPEEPENPTPEEPEKPTPEEPGTEEPEEPVVIDYCWFSSDSVSMIVQKLGTPTAALYIDNNEAEPTNYIKVDEVEFARYYQFTALKYDEHGSVVKSHTFDKYQINEENEYFKTQVIDGKTSVLFNLQAVADLDALVPDQPNPFGQEFSIYCQVFEIDRNYDFDLSQIYSISNKSNVVAVEVPVTPTNLVVNSTSGLITWENNSNNTKTRIRIYYNGSDVPTIYETEPGVNRFKLETIGTFDVSVLSFITTSNDIEITSGYSQAVTGSFMIFESGSGKQEDPYILSQSSHLFNIDYYLDSYYELKNDIELTDGDIASLDGILIGRSGGVFNGKLEGNNFTIKNLQFAYNANQIAVFKEIGTQGEVKNLNIGIKTGSSKYISNIIAGLAIVNRGTITNVQTMKLQGVDGNGELIYQTSKNQIVAGLVYQNYGTITGAINNMTISYYGSGSQGMNTQVAGLVASNFGTITESGNTANLKGTVVGGLVVDNQGNVNKSYNKGNISAIAVNADVQAKAGGIVVNNRTITQGTTYKGVIESCYVVMSELIVSNVSGAQNKGFAGGIVADNSSETLSKCYVVIENGNISMTETTFGAITGVDNRSSVASYYNNNYYLINNVSQGLGGSSTNIATSVSSSAGLNVLVTNFGTIYASDTLGLNKGYPVFVWQNS